MNTCCGKEVKTRFCPHCGREVNRKPAEGLLDHVAKIMGVKERAAERSREWAETNNNDKRCERRVQQDEATARKWLDWHNALVSLLLLERSYERGELK